MAKATGRKCPGLRVTIHTTISSMTRAKISVTVDPEVLRLVDRYVQDHRGLDRSKVMEEALGLWLARRQASAMEAQYAGEDDVPEDEVASWRSVRRQAAKRRLGRE